ncbi:hypothetical protein JB92DRAFT_3140729 [Gautieria morchelliformis]|nr:hypothetical protein JB92DRAFT_3140729 [Gautieria morchelliformis]
MSAIDRNSLWSTGHDESVEVNQRALIDKVLARYSGEFTVFRELLQNSDDAASKAVEIRFESKPYLERVGGSDSKQLTVLDLTQPVHQWIFRNNGMIFREEGKVNFPDKSVLTDRTRRLVSVEEDRWEEHFSLTSSKLILFASSAEGNPDEEKIGAFGVGFYSLFSVTEEPFVKSGDQWMGFYWKDKKDQLFARRGALPESSDSDPYRQWTTFEMGLREAAPMPSAFDFVRFLTSSITFMTHLDEVTVWFDGRRLAKLTKDKGVTKELPLPAGLRNTSDGKMMSMRQVKTTSLNISAEVLRLVYTGGSERKPPPRAERRVSKLPTNAGFFSSLFSSLSAGPNPIVPRTPPQLSSLPLETLDPMCSVHSHVILSVFCGEVDVSLSQKMTTELHRSTKKNPPTKIKLELIYTGKDEYEASKKDEEGLFEGTGSFFQGLRADLDGTKSARIFIGHATGQTTGIGGHISGRFIPTVERESIDLVDRNVAIWNKELLYVGGLLARTAYEVELANIRALWVGASEGIGKTRAGPDPDLRIWLQGRCLHALRFFAFHASTPSPVVANLLQAAFFSSSLDGSFPILSTQGVLDARNVRAFDPAYAGFLKELPVLPLDIGADAKSMTETLRTKGMIQDVTFKDVLAELRSRALSETEMLECLKWRITLNTDGIHSPYLVELRREFLEAGIFTISTVSSENAVERVVPLSSIKTVHIPRNATAAIPTEGPLPDHTLPLSLSRLLKAEALSSVFGWSELTIPVWLAYLVSPSVESNSPDFDLTKSAVWAETVLNVLARSWPSLSRDHQAQVVQLLKSKQCIPTKFGMKLPEESYFLNANVFPDLPIVTLPKGTVVRGSLEKVLLALGVLQHVNLQVVFHRMVGTGDWGIPDLIRYLVAVESSLTPTETDRLRQTVAFTKEEEENQPNGNPSVSSPQEARPKKRYRAMDLYEPSSVLRELGLPIIAWGASPKWRISSDEAKFLFNLGLRRHPPLEDLVSLAASPNTSIREASMKYLMDNTSSKYSEYDPQMFLSLAYVPAQRSNGDAFLSKPLEVFTDREFAIMGFLSPPASLIIATLEGTPPKDPVIAREWFELLAGHLSEFTQAEMRRLSSTSFIPVVSSATSNVKASSHSEARLLAPNKCYLGRGSSTAFHSKLFTFIDFGPRANNFLTTCGVRNEPTVDELAQILVADPRSFYKLAGSYNKFVDELRNIAVNYHGVMSSTRNQMKTTPCLVASRRIARASTNKRHKRSDNTSDEEDEGRLEHDLLIPSKIAIIDDTVTSVLFDTVFSAPQEDYIEQLYSNLGSPRLSTLVREEYKPTDIIRASQHAVKTRHLVLERLPLFLHERTPAQAAVSYSWLENSDNFVVTEVGKLVLTRTLQFGQTRIVKTQEASATAERKGKGPIRLWIAGNNQLDLFEVSNSLCRVILQRHKANDSLLFMTILSTDLKSLRRRGYNVDRLLQKAVRDAKAAREPQVNSESNQIGQNNVQTNPQRGLAISTDAPDAPGYRGSSANKTGSGILSNFRQMFKPSSPPSVPSSPPKHLGPPPLLPPKHLGPPPLLPPKPFTNGPPGIKDPMAPYSQGPNWKSDQEVTPHANIERNVRAAIEGCKAEKNSVVRSQTQMTRVKEAMDEGYCDTVGAQDLEYFGDIGYFKIYISSQGRPEVAATITAMHAAIERFGAVLRPLIELYKVPSTSVHIFYDVTGPLIAFNRNGSLFMNARYYIAWHDLDVQQGNVAQAYTAWYFTLAHEIAHNLVHPHNSEHEFYFSTICEQYMVGFAALLNSPQGQSSLGSAH